MPQQDYEITLEFSFELGNKKFKGALGLNDNGKSVGIDIECSEMLRPIDTEKALYQVAHILAEQTRTVSQLRNEKRNLWQ